MEKERLITFSKKDSLAVKGIAIVMMIFHHCFIEISVLEQYGVSFGSLSREKVVWVCLWLKICVSLFAFVSGYGLYTGYKKKNGSKVEWVIRRLIKTLSGFWIVFILAGIVCQEKITGGKKVLLFIAESVALIIICRWSSGLDVTYSFGYFLWTAVFCLMSALLISIILEGLKRLIRYNVWIEWLQE